MPRWTSYLLLAAAHTTRRAAHGPASRHRANGNAHAPASGAGARAAAGNAPESELQPPRWLGLIHTVNEVQLVVLGDTRDQVQRSIAEHISHRAPDVLWPDDCARVCELASEGEFDAAIDLYFARVGERWDEERLTIREVAV